MKESLELEKTIEGKILHYLNSSGKNFAFKVETQGQYDERIKAFRKRGKFALPGTSDVIGITSSGKFFALEIKRKGGKASPAQIVFIDKIKRMNGIAAIVFSVDDVIALGL